MKTAEQPLCLAKIMVVRAKQSFSKFYHAVVTNDEEVCMKGIICDEFSRRKGKGSAKEGSSNESPKSACGITSRGCEKRSLLATRAV
mmetsp:Transcript_30091/g.44908  ORF Transcript_30091/g.44908 Transcript_30091/m.44908 type:complete len:87 (-) Transcript_30091:254-514(-)